jgi:flagellar biogenesis protein FliO
VTAALSTYLMESALILMVVAGLAWFITFLARRAGVARGASSLELLARLPLEARRAVYVVRVLDQVLILGASETGLAKLGDLPPSALAEFRKAPAALSWLALLEARLTSRGDSAHPQGKAAP